MSDNQGEPPSNVIEFLDARAVTLSKLPASMHAEAMRLAIDLDIKSSNNAGWLYILTVMESRLFRDTINGEFRDTIMEFLAEATKVTQGLPEAMSEATFGVSELVRKQIERDATTFLGPIREASSEMARLLKTSGGHVKQRLVSDLETLTDKYQTDMTTLAGNEHTAFRENIKKTIEQAAKQMVTVEVKHQMKMEKTYAALSVIAKAVVLSLVFLAGFHLADLPASSFGGICHNVSSLIFGWFW